jgi:CRISPR/Cas system-associated endonuclease Cas1
VPFETRKPSLVLDLIEEFRDGPVTLWLDTDTLRG